MELRQLTKRFGDATAVDGLHLDVPQGSWFGLVGPNGAGKTTALSMAVGLLHPDSGSAALFGVDVWSRPDEAKALVGVLPDGRSLPQRLTGWEVLSYLGLLRGMHPDVVEDRSREILAAMDLEAASATLVVDYSTGMRKKLGLAAALLHGPRLLVLDEPFEAVDPLSAATVRTILADFVAGGGSVVMSSHVMALVEQVCDRVAVMAAGQVVVAGPLDEVRAGRSLEGAFAEVLHAGPAIAGLSWLRS